MNQIKEIIQDEPAEKLTEVVALLHEIRKAMPSNEDTARTGEELLLICFQLRDIQKFLRCYFGLQRSRQEVL